MVKPNFMNVFHDKVVCFSLILHRNMRAVEIIGTEDCHGMFFTSGCTLLTVTVHPSSSVSQGQ